MIVPFQAGVTADLLFRGIAESASKHLGQPVIIDNKPGGSATLGPADMAATAKPDGYTVAQIAIPIYRVPYMQKATFDPVKDFTYIIQLGGYSLGTVVKADSPFKTGRTSSTSPRPIPASSPTRRSARPPPTRSPWS